MRLFHNTAAIILPLALLGACTTADLTELQGTTLPDQPFQATLAAEYRSFAVWEAEQYDWPDSQHFARKGLRAAAGEMPAPEPLENWRLPAGERDALARSRRQLVALLDGGARERAPELAARAQFLFDCWVEQQEENWQFDHIAACRNGLQGVFAELAAVPPKETNYLVYFDFDKAELSAAAQLVLADAAREAGLRGTARVAIHGHADRAGATAYNMKLSRARAEAVARFLGARGIEPWRIAVRALGESEPRQSTADGVREPANRRAEIFVRPHDDAGPVAALQGE